MKRVAWLLLVASLNTGCATHYLWTQSQGSSFREPAPDPKLALYADAKGRNVLAVYREMNEQNDRLVSRAYFVIRNSRPVFDSHRPFFVEPEMARELHPIPLLLLTNQAGAYAIGPNANTASGWGAIFISGEQKFRLFKDGQPQATFDLPVYDDGSAIAKRVFLTPWTVALDVTLIGGYIYVRAGAPVLWR